MIGLLASLLIVSIFANEPQPLIRANPSSTNEQTVRFDGNNSAPFDRRYEVVIGNQTERYHLRFSTANIKEFHPRLQQTISLLKLDQGELTPKEQEMGSIFVQYTDGHMAHVNFTSKKIDTIDGHDFGYAIESSRILSQRTPLRIINIHTHPNPKNPLLEGTLKYIGPSLADYEQWIFVKERFAQMGIENFEYLSVVVPSCDACQDLAFVIDDSDLDYFRSAN